MKISVILVFLLSWSFVSSNPYHKKSDDTSVDELNHANDGGSDSLNSEGKEPSDDASSGKDWGGNFLSFLIPKVSDDIDKNNHAGDKPPLLTLILEALKTGKNVVDQTIGGIKKLVENKLHNIPLFGNDSSGSDNKENFITWIQKNIQTLFTNNDDDTGSITKTEDSTPYTDEKTEHSNRVKRELKTLSSGHLWSNLHKPSISEHVLKLSEGTVSKVLRSEKATVAEALNSRAAIRKILAQAKAEAAKAARHKNLYDNDGFSKWLLSGSSFDIDIFNHPYHQPSFDVNIAEHSKSENTDDSRHHTFSISQHASIEPINHHHRETKHTFSTLSDSTAMDSVNTERSYAKLLHKSKHQEHLSPELEITSGEKHGHETNGMFRKPTVSHRSLFYEDAENTGLRHVSSHAHAPHVHFRVTEDEETGNDIPKWKHRKWGYTDSHVSPRFHSAKSFEFETSKEREKYEKEFIFKRTFDTAGDSTENEGVRTGYRRKNHKTLSKMDIDEKIDDRENEETAGVQTDSREKSSLERKRHYYDGNREHSIYSKTDGITYDNTKEHHITGSLNSQRTLSVDLYRGKSIGNKNKHYKLDGVQRSAIYFPTSAEILKGAKKKQSGNMLITNISTGTPTRKATNIDIESYHSRDQNTAANTAASFLSGLSDEKGSKHTNNVVASPSVDDRSAAAKRKAESDYSVLGRTGTVIDNDATSAEIERGFSGIKSRPRADFTSAHSSLSRTYSKTHLEDQEVVQHREYQRFIADADASLKMRHSMDSDKNEQLNHVKTQTSSAGEYENDENCDLKENNKVNAGVASSAEAMTSTKRAHRYGLSKTSSSDDLRNLRDYTETRKKHRHLKGNYRSTARHKTSIEVIDINGGSAEVHVAIPEFQIPTFKKGYALHDINYDDSDDQDLRGDQNVKIDEAAENSKKDETDYDGLEKEEFAANDEISEKSVMSISDERRIHGRNSRHKTHDKYDQNAHRSKHNQHTHNVTSSTASNITESETRNKYLYFTREQQTNESNQESLEASMSIVKKIKKQNSATDKELLSHDRNEKEYTINENNRMHLEKHNEWPVHEKQLITKKVPDLQNAHSVEINKITSDKIEGKGEIRSENNMSENKNRKIVTHTENVIYDGFEIDNSQDTNIKKIINDNSHHQQSSWKSKLLGNSQADVQTKIKRVYNVHEKNKNVDTSMKQAAETMEFTDPKNKFQHVSMKTSSASQSYAEPQAYNEHYTSESNKSKNIVTKIQTVNEGNLFNGVKNGYQNDNNLYKKSISSDKSRIETKHHSKEESEIIHEINTNVETAKTLSNNIMNKSQSDEQNVISSFKSSAGLQRSEYYLSDQKKETISNMSASASANLTVSASNQESLLENTLSVPKSFVKSGKGIENYSNDLKNTGKIINLGSSSTISSKSSVGSEIKTEQKSNDFGNTEISSIATHSNNTKNLQLTSSSNLSEKIQTKTDLTNYKNSQAYAVSKASAEAIFSDVISDKHQSSLQKSFSSSSSISSENSQTRSEYNSNKLQNGQINIISAESSIKSTLLDNAETEHWSDLSKSSLSSKLLEETHMENKHNSNNQTETQEELSELENAFSSKSSHVTSNVENVENGYYSNVVRDNEKNVIKKASSKTSNSTQIENAQQSESQNVLSFSPSSADSFSTSSADSQTKSEHHSDDMTINDIQNIDVTNASKAETASSSAIENQQQQESINSLSSSSIAESWIKNMKTSMSNIISKDIVSDRHNLHILSSSQILNKNDLNVPKEDPDINTASLTSLFTDVNDDHHRHKDNKDDMLQAKWLDPTNQKNIEKFKNKEIKNSEIFKQEDSEDTLNAASSMKHIASTDIKNTRNTLTTSSLIESNAKMWVHNEYDLSRQKKEEIITDNSVMSKTTATSMLNKTENGDKNEMLKISSLSDSYSASKDKREHDISIIQNNQESMAIVKSSESMVSNNNERSENDLTEKTTLSGASEETQEKQNDFDVSEKKFENAMSKVAIEVSNNINNIHQDDISKSISSDVSEKIRQATEQLNDENKVHVSEFIKSESKDNDDKSENDSVKLKSSYDPDNKKYVENEINHGGLKNMKGASKTNGIISMESATFNDSFNSESQNNLLKVITSNSLHAKISQKDKHKPDALSNIDETASIKDTFHDDKQKRGSILPKVIVSSDLHDEAQIKQTDYYNMPKELVAFNDNEKFMENNLIKMVPYSGLQMESKFENTVENTPREGRKDIIDIIIPIKIIKTNLEDDNQNDLLTIKFNTNLQDKYERELNTKDQSKIDHDSNILQEKEIINSEIYNNINEQATESSSSHAESQDKKVTWVEKEISTGSMASSINKDIYDDNSMQEKSLFDRLDIAEINGKERNYGDEGIDMKDNVKDSIYVSNMSPSQNDVKEKVYSALQSNQSDLTVHTQDSAITSNTLSTQETSEMQNLRQDLSEVVASSDSHTNAQYENTDNILRERSEIAASAAKSAQTISSRKLESEAQRKVIMIDSLKSDSHTISQIEAENNLNVLQEEQIITNVTTSGNSADSNYLKNTQDDPVTKNSLYDNENSDVLKNNLSADAIASAREESHDGTFKDGYQNSVTTTTSLSNSEVQTGHECDSGVQRPIDMIFSSDTKKRVTENKNIANNMEGSEKVAANTVASAEAISFNIESAKEQDSTKLSSSNLYAKSQDNTRLLNMARDNQETRASAIPPASACINNEEELLNKEMKTEDEKHNIRETDLKNSEDNTTTIRRTTNNNIKNENQDDLLQMASLINSFADTRIKNNHESSVLEKQFSVIVDSTTSTDSKDLGCIDSNDKSDLKQLSATPSSNAYAKSSVENGSVSTSAQTMISGKSKNTEEDKSLQITTSSSEPYADARMKDERAKGIKRDPGANVNTKTETISSADIKNVDDLFDAQADAATEAENKGTSQEAIIEKGFSETSSNLFSEAQVENTHRSEILRDNNENSAIVDTIAKTENSNQDDWQKGLHKTASSSDSVRDTQYDSMKSMSSANSYAAEQTTSEDITEHEKEDREVSINISTLEGAEARKEVKGVRSSDWLVTTSGVGTLAEERAQNKDKFNVLRKVKEAAVYAGTSAGAAASNNIEDEQHDVHVEHPSERRDNSNVAKKILDFSGASTEIIASGGAETTSENSIFDSDMTISLFNDAEAKDEKRRNISSNVQSSVDMEETQSSIAADSSVSASSDTNSAKHNATSNNEISATSVNVPNTSKEIHLSSSETTPLHPPQKISKCDNDGTREFISEASSLYQMLDKRRDSEVLLMKKNPEGPVQIASLKNSGVPPLIAYRLISQEAYEKIRAIIVNKQIFCTDCPLSNT